MKFKNLKKLQDSIDECPDKEVIAWAEHPEYKERN